MRARLLLAWVIAILGTACGSSSVTVTTPTTAKCNITVTNSVIGSMAAAGGNGVLSITTTRDCSWSASSTASWVSLAAPTSGQGSGSLAYSVAANTQPAQRNATIDVSSNSTAIVQDPAPCRYVLTTPNGTTVPQGGGSLTVGVQTLSGCAWNASSDAGWIAFAGSTVGNGPATVAVNVGANAGAARSGNVTIGGQAITIQQPGPPPPPPTPPPPSPPPPSPPPPTPPPPSPPPPPPTPPPPACTFSISPNSLNLGAGGGRGGASVTAGAGCSWTVASSDSWIVVDQGSSSGQGNGTVTFSVSANHGSARTGALIIAGQSFTVSQAGDTPPPPPVCSFTISPTNKHLGADGGSDSVTVSASASTCSWTASSNADWISVKDGASGHGDGKVSYSVDKNKQEGSRTGTLSIAGKTFTVTEEGQGHGGS